MLKFLQRLLLLAALCVPWATQAQISCDGNPPDTVANGTGTSTTNYFPGYSFYNYSYSEVIIPASTLSNYLTNEFKGLMFNPTVTTAGTYFTNCTIYLANTTVNSLSSGFIDDPATFEMVFTGNLSYTSTGWQTVEFDDSFMWDGSSNIVVAVVRSHGSYSSGATFAAYSAGGTLGRYCYRDSPGPFVIGSINNSGASSGSTSTVPQYKLLGCEGEPPTCFKVRNLTVLDINSTGATISWIDTMNSGASYTIYNMEDTSVVASNLTDTFYTFANLTPNTQYRFGIEVNCGGGDVVGYSYVSLRTTCTPINELPYVNDFESDPHYSGTPYADAFPSCWTRINDATNSYNYYPYLYAYPTYAHSGTTGMYWYQTTSSGYAQNEYAVLPPIDLTVYSISDLTLSFYARTTSSSYHPAPIVGVMTNPDDASTFTPVYTFPANAITTVWQLFVVPLSDYTGTGNLIAIKWPNPSTTSYMAIDDIYLTDEWCDVPGQVSIEYGLTEITLSWESNGASNFTVFLGNDTVSALTDTFYTFNNLTPNTAYNYGVAAECSNGLSMFIGGSLTTLCTPLDSLPYVQTFESAPSGGSNYTTFVECMFRLNNGTDYFGYPYVSSSSSYNHTPGGSKGLYWYNTTTTVTYGDYQYVIMPGIDSDYIALDTLQLKFWAKSSSTSYFPEFQVGVMTNPYDANTFELIGNITVGNSTEWQEFITPLGGYEGYGHYIALRALRPSSSWYAYVDDITIEAVPHCPPIVDLEVSGTTTQYARIQWGYMSGIIEDEPDGYDIVLYEEGSTNAPSTFTSTDPYYVFSGLTPGTTYKAFVNVNCGDEVGMADSIVFSTASFGCAVADPDAADTVYFSNSNTGISGCLAYSSWGNTAYQTIYTADELIAAGLAPGPISGIDLGFTSSTYAKEFTIFMGNTSTTSINNATLEDPNQFVQVYGPASHPTGTSGWQHYDFTTPFVWDGSSSIILTTFMNQPTGQSQSSSSGLTGYYVPASNKARYRYKDSNPFTLNDYNSGNSGGTYSYRASIHFYSFECLTASTCAAPAVWAANVTRDSVYLEWLPGADESSWTVYMDTVLLGTTTSNDFAVGGLAGFTEYTFNVVNDCGDETYVGSVTVTTLPDDAWNTLPVACTFDSNDMDAAWIRVNDNQINKWTIGMASDSRALMISDDGVNNTYNISSTSASHAYMRIVLPAGEYAYSFDWRAYGESSLDYLLAYVVPDSYSPTAGSYSIPGNAIRIDGGSYLNQQGTWQTRSDVFSITDSGTYKIVFTWRNDGSVGTMPP
ncbi:MAG: fibronectin type III domain-containing protein, partial [Bacteroidales bacterium]|nr:fibronectin type III domain-containing protein [Bacteroidales bacterium]